MPSPTRRRPRCERCCLPKITCFCARAVPLQHRTRVLILQHPDEAGHAKGTAQLLHLSLAHSRLAVGEVFDADVLHRWIGDGPAVLLYPHDAGTEPPIAAEATVPACLVVLDGTWRKSRRLLASNPALQSLPRLALVDPPAGRYAVRKAQRAGQLSTLEATVLALRTLEGHHPSQDDLLASFDRHVEALQSRQATPPA